MARIGLVVTWLVSLFGLGYFQGHDHGHSTHTGGGHSTNDWMGGLGHQSQLPVIHRPRQSTGMRSDIMARPGQRGTHGVGGTHGGISVQHGNGSPVSTRLEIPMQIPQGMSMEEARQSGILEALAHDQSLRPGGASSPRGIPAQSAPIQAVVPGSPSGIPMQIPMQIPEGMSIEEARRSGILDALAHDASTRTGGASSSQGRPLQPAPVHTVFPETGHVHAGSGMPSGTIDVRGRGRSGRRGRQRNRNGRRRNGRRRVRPANEPVDVLIDSSGAIVSVETPIEPASLSHRPRISPNHHAHGDGVGPPGVPDRGIEVHGLPGQHHPGGPSHGSIGTIPGQHHPGGPSHGSIGTIPGQHHPGGPSHGSIGTIPGQHHPGGPSHGSIGTIPGQHHPGGPSHGSIGTIPGQHHPGGPSHGSIGTIPGQHHPGGPSHGSIGTIPGQHHPGALPHDSIGTIPGQRHPGTRPHSGPGIVPGQHHPGGPQHSGIGIVPGQHHPGGPQHSGIGIVPGQHHSGGPQHSGIGIVPGHDAQQGPGTSGGIVGELMRTAAQIASGGVLNTPLLTWQRQGNRNNPVQITRSGPMHPHTQPQLSGFLINGGGINPIGPNQGNPIVHQLGNSLFNALGNMLG